jgi:hypothetical protein
MCMTGVDLGSSALRGPCLCFHTQSRTKLARVNVPSADPMATPATALPDKPERDSVDGAAVVVVVIVTVAVAVDGANVDVLVELGSVM